MADAAIELPRLAARLKAAGMGGIRREMVSDLRKAAQPMVPKLRDAAEAKLPRSGGLNDIVAGQPIRVSVRTGARSAGVSIRAQWTRTNRGKWRHPVFGNRDVWVTQTNSTAEGWFDKTAQQNSRQVRDQMETILAKVSLQVNGGPGI